MKSAVTKEELMVAHVLKAMEFAVNVNKFNYNSLDTINVFYVILFSFI